MWPKLFLTVKRDHVKTETQDPITDRQYVYFYIFSHATLNETFTAKYDGVLPRTP